jgi:transposase
MSDELEDLKSRLVIGHKRARRGRKPLDPALPREVVRHELPEGERMCPHDGATLREIGVLASEQLDIIPQQVRVIRHERVKYACPCCDGTIRLAARPAQVIPKGLFTESALAWIATSKYLDGLPLYRQAALLGRFGGTDISRNTVAGSIVRLGQLVQPVVNLLRDELLDSPLVFGDETELQVLKEPGRSAQARSYVWAQMTNGSGQDGTGPPIRLFTYSPSRSTKTAMALYAGIRPQAVLMTDGYEVYDNVAQALQLVHLGCWTHCRRCFHEALQALPKEQRGPNQLAARFIALIGKLYEVEAQARRDGIPAPELGHRRQRESMPVLCEIEALLLANLHAVLPKSLLGQALHYLSSQWSKLRRYVEDGRYSTTSRRTGFAPPASAAATGCSPTQWTAPPQARTCTRCCRRARSTASTVTATCEPCLPSCPKPRRPTTTLHCCPGASTCPRTKRSRPRHGSGGEAQFIDRIRPSA